MKPIDARTATWDEVRANLTGRRLAAYDAWKCWGPGTTHEVAERSGMSVLTLRPRTTELVQLGFVVMTEMAHKEGIYQAVSEENAMDAFTTRQMELRGSASQLPLKLQGEKPAALFNGNICRTCGLMFDTSSERYDHEKSGECEG